MWNPICEDIKLHKESFKKPKKEILTIYKQIDELEKKKLNSEDISDIEAIRVLLQEMVEQYLMK